MNDQFKSQFELKTSIVSDWIRSWLDAEEKLLAAPQSTLTSTLARAAHYSLSLSGKKIRPVLVLAVGEMLGVEEEKLRDFAIGVECLHTASLIHDDLPCLDNDTLRRGQPTCHVKFGEPIALLAGDYLIAKSHAVIANSQTLPADSKIDLLQLLLATTERLCEGQAKDIEARDHVHLAIEEAQRMLRLRHLDKTAALISAATVGPALVKKALSTTGAGLDDVKILKTFGDNLGLLFQITDDILDVVSSAEVLGKTPLSDEALGTPTYVTLHGLDGAKALACNTSDLAKQCLAGYGDKAKFLAQLCDFVLTRSK